MARDHTETVLNADLDVDNDRIKSRREAEGVIVTRAFLPFPVVHHHTRNWVAVRRLCLCDSLRLRGILVVFRETGTQMC